jgi:hypothetical protein
MNSELLSDLINGFGPNVIKLRNKPLIYLDLL